MQTPEDMGKIIGKSGRIIRALRYLIKLMAVKQGVYVDVVIAEEIQKFKKPHFYKINLILCVLVF